jgi:type I restriction enzyme S subunit
MIDELPNGWAAASLNLLCERLRGVSYARDEASVEPKRGSVPILRANNIQNDRLVFDDLVYVPTNRVSDEQRIRKGDVIIAMSSGSKSVVGKTAQASERWDGGFGAFCGVLRSSPELNSRYVGLFLRTRDYRHRISELSAGTSINNLKAEHFSEIEVPIAPLAEQRRIVAKLEKLLGQVDACQQRLAKIPVLLKRFRQSTLDAATTGRLTANWRNNQRKPFDAKTELDSYLAAAEQQRARTREAEPTEGHETLTEAVPDDWVTSSLDDLFRFIDYRGKTPTKSRSGKRLISAKNIKMGYISEEPIEYVSEEFYDAWMTRGFPKQGDIFFVTEGHTMGFAALNNRSDKFALSQRTITLQPWQPLETRCFFYFIMSSLFQNLVRLNATGSAAVGIKAAKFRGLPIPFPSLPEQKEIVRRIEALFALADQIEARFVEGRTRVDSIAQAILAKAFRGELVPTEFELAKAEGRSFESAQELLKRIGANGEPKEKKAKGSKSEI